MKLYLENYRNYKKVVLPGLNGNTYSASKVIYRNIYRDSPLFESMQKVYPSNKGGIITFSTDVNSLKQSDKVVIDLLKKKIRTIINRLFSMRKIDKVVSSENVLGWTVGKYLHGRYFDKNGKLFDENSLSLEIIDVSTQILDNIAYELLDEFQQESVLVKNYDTQEVYFIYDDNT